MTIKQLIERLQRHDENAEVVMAHIMRDRVSVARFQIAAVVPKEGQILLCDKDLVNVLRQSLGGAN